VHLLVKKKGILRYQDARYNDKKNTFYEIHKNLSKVRIN